MKAWKDNPWVWVVSFEVLSTTGKPVFSPSGEMSARQRGILFSTDMVKAILDGRKTQTRRLKKLDHVNQSPLDWIIDELQILGRYIFHGPEEVHIPCPYGKPGDLLWVRETFAYGAHKKTISFKLTDKLPFQSRWKPSIHMPKSAARIWLQITDIRVERLQDITEEDAIAEGIELQESIFCSADRKAYRNYQSEYALPYCDPIPSFQSLWDSINAKPKTQNQKLRTQNPEPRTKTLKP